MLLLKHACSTGHSWLFYDLYHRPHTSLTMPTVAATAGDAVTALLALARSCSLHN